jgi:hypothetical protein
MRCEHLSHGGKFCERGRWASRDRRQLPLAEAAADCAEQADRVAVLRSTPAFVLGLLVHRAADALCSALHRASTPDELRRSRCERLFYRAASPAGPVLVRRPIAGLAVLELAGPSPCSAQDPFPGIVRACGDYARIVPRSQPARLSSQVQRRMTTLTGSASCAGLRSPPHGADHRHGERLSRHAARSTPNPRPAFPAPEHIASGAPRG